MTDVALDYKEEAIKCWTVYPCVAGAAGDGEPGTRAYFETLVRGRREYAPWMTDALGCEDAWKKRSQSSTSAAGNASDLCEFASRGAEVTGIDRTPRHVDLARAHLAMRLEATLIQGDKRMAFADSSLDLEPPTAHSPTPAGTEGSTLACSTPSGVSLAGMPSVSVSRLCSRPRMRRPRGCPGEALGQTPTSRSGGEFSVLLNFALWHRHWIQQGYLREFPPLQRLNEAGPAPRMQEP